ncbi:tyrosine-type recombinase/integrase [Facklamia hominis]|uniref:Tyrosine-type recombinase/integrase n=1 Tax=Facklamia hominis TaxID=178214 RepID=A0AAJ1Q4Y1_9LACT|nr:tyrosine-type recombinase/integrase [Facklamia hominis]MDK7187510.1 tyrosine-type recombinase/integrase [Facklamia hominis]
MATYKQYKKGTDELWQVRGYIGVDPLTGSKKQIRRSGFRTKKEARQAYDKARREFELGLTQEMNKRFTYEQVYHEWLDLVYKDSVKESTLNKTLSYFKIHILPRFGKYYIDKITDIMLQKALNDWHKKYKKHKTYYNQTVRVLDYAFKKGYIRVNPKEKVLTEKKKIHYESEQGDFEIYTKDQLKQFLGYLKSKGDVRWHCFFRLLAFTGMRKGEALALTWNDIHFKDGTLTINKTLSHGIGNRLIINSPKTEAGNRTISVDAGTIQILKEWKATQAKLMLQHGFNTMKPNQLLFSKYSTNEPLDPSTPYNRMKTITRLSGLPMMKVHGFRHTHCTLLFNAGVSINDVKNRLGHADIQTTMNIYAHITKEQEKESAEKFAQFVGF